MDAGVSFGDLIDHAIASIVVAAVADPVAPHVWIVHFFLCNIAHVDLGLVGSGARVGFNDGGCAEAAFYSGGCIGICRAGITCDDFDQWMDAKTGQALANIAPTDLSCGDSYGAALLLAQVRQKRLFDCAGLCSDCRHTVAVAGLPKTGARCG